MDEVAACNYLLPSPDAFWEWRENGQVVTWQDGNTIAFRTEIVSVLRQLSCHGLPNFGPLIAVLAATRDNWRDATVEHRANVTRVLEIYDSLQDVISRSLDGLDRVSELDVELRSSVAAKAIICDLVFQRQSRRTSPSKAQAVIAFLERASGEELTLRDSDRSSFSASKSLILALRGFDEGLQLISEETLRMLLRTGLDDVPQSADLDLPQAERVRALIAELQDDAELRGLARLASDLMAAVSLPRTITDSEELPIGGVSDITNRGPLDRLLLTELAHDNLTLAVRVAVNEALYLRRESPPRNPSRQRAMLLESGIRSWGVPRVFSTAVALAVTATTQGNTEISAFRSSGAGVEPVDLTTRAGLIAHLEALEPSLHPGDALAAFRDEMQAMESTAEPMFVTTEDVLEDDEFSRALAAAELAPLHIATVNRCGHFRLLDRTTRGCKVVREAKLSLEDLFDEPRKAESLLNPKLAQELPAIFSVAPFPLLLPISGDAPMAWRVEGGGALSITHDRRLLHFTRKEWGGKQISDDIPSGPLQWHSTAPNMDRVAAVVGHPNGTRPQLLNIDLSAGTCSSHPLEVQSAVYQCVCSHNGALFAVCPRSVDVFSLPGGRRIQSLAQPSGITWQRDRFFLDKNNLTWYALSFDGRTARFESVISEREAKCPRMMTMFDVVGVADLIGVTSNGDLYSTATGNLRRVNHCITQPRPLAFSATGDRIVLGQPELAGHQGVCAVVDVHNLEVHRVYGEPTSLAEPLHDVLSHANLRKHFITISVDEAGDLTLVSRKGDSLDITFDYVNDTLRLTPSQTAYAAKHKRLGFKRLSRLLSTGYRLSVATWNDGSQAFLDSRGLLHLKSADRKIPEATIVLSDKELSGWTSDGHLWGVEYFISERVSASTLTIFTTAIKAFAERLR